MLAVITPEEAARLDRASSVPVALLMERAGLAVALAAARMGMAYGDRVVVLAGPGNNGGDGYVAARYLRKRGVDVVVHALSVPRTEAAAAAAQAAVQAGVPIRQLGEPVNARLVIDALFGGGVRRGLPEVVRPWLGVSAPVLAVDIPTGVDPITGEVDDLAFRADRTVVFHALKPGHLLGEGPDRCGHLEVADIGLSGGVPVMMVAEAADAPRPLRPRSAYKWSAGSVLVVGGSHGMIGAATMAARSALHFGAGSVGIATPNPELAQALVPEILAYPIDDLPDRYDLAVLGPGLGREQHHVVAKVLERFERVVLDADGINTVRIDQLQAVDGHVVLTPHAAEFSRLAHEEPGPAAAEVLAERTGCVVVLKGNPTLVTDGGPPWIVRSGGPELATIGTGDVLSGMIAALWSRGLAGIDAARSAAYWHGVAGADLATDTTVTADLLCEHVGRFAWDRP